MTPLTQEWVDKAEGDFATAERELQASVMPNFDAVCFHSQQCAEKYLKARLNEAKIPFPKTHNLSALLDLLLPIEPSWRVLRLDLQSLNLFAIGYRYPGFFADKKAARKAIVRCRKIRKVCRRSLGLGGR
jgi:HEPN domain-containing protein